MATSAIECLAELARGSVTIQSQMADHRLSAAVAQALDRRHSLQPGRGEATPATLSGRRAWKLANMGWIAAAEGLVVEVMDTPSRRRGVGVVRETSSWIIRAGGNVG